MLRHIQIAGLALALSIGAAGAVLADPAAPSAMSNDHMAATKNSMSTGDHMSSGAMSTSDHMSSGAMTSGTPAATTDETKKAKKATDSGSMSTGAMAPH